MPATYLKLLKYRAMFMIYCSAFFLVATILFIIHLPIRLIKSLRSNEKSPPPPSVELITHEPTSGYHPLDTLLFIHGFPDSPALFDSQVRHLTKKGYRCLVVALPGCNGERVSRALTPSETSQLIHSAVIAVHKEPLTVIAHDWGSLYTGLLMRSHPKMFRRAIFLDVGKYLKIDISEWLGMLSYQLLLAWLYVLGHPCGTLVLRTFLRYIKYNARPVEEVTVDMCAPYLGILFWNLRGLLSRRKSAQKKRRIPYLFIYGQWKLFRFHDERWLEFVRKTPCGEVVGMPCDHWVQHDQAEECNLLITQWLSRSAQAANETSTES